MTTFKSIQIALAFVLVLMAALPVAHAESTPGQGLKRLQEGYGKGGVLEGLFKEGLDKPEKPERPQKLEKPEKEAPGPKDGSGDNTKGK